MMVARANAQSEKNRPFVNRRLSQCGHRRLSLPPAPVLVIHSDCSIFFICFFRRVQKV